MCLYQVLMDLSGLVKPSATLSYSGMCTVATSRCVIPSLSLQAKMVGRPDGDEGHFRIRERRPETHQLDPVTTAGCDREDFGWIGSLVGQVRSCHESIAETRVHPRSRLSMRRARVSSRTN